MIKPTPGMQRPEQDHPQEKEQLVQNPYIGMTLVCFRERRNTVLKEAMWPRVRGVGGGQGPECASLSARKQTWTSL